jgi:AraC family transcriptional regulator
METTYRQEPSFFEKRQTILKYSCDENIFNISSLSEFSHPVNSNGFAIKFVTEGVEQYRVNKQSFAVGNGSYLLLNGEKEASVVVDSKTNVKGLCINISTKVIAEVTATLARPDTPYADPELASFFYTDHFLENQYQSINTLLGAKLQDIADAIEHNQFSTEDINAGLFYVLAERLIIDQTTVFKQLQAIRSVKHETRRDLCRRLLRGRDFIDAAYAETLSIKQIAQESAMSEFHFFRLFKMVFGISPHQYILNKRLNVAGKLLKDQHAVSEVALQCGFADIHAFSKTFKKHFGTPPSVFAGSKHCSLA